MRTAIKGRSAVRVSSLILAVGAVLFCVSGPVSAQTCVEEENHLVRLKVEFKHRSTGDIKPFTGTGFVVETNDPVPLKRIITAAHVVRFDANEAVPDAYKRTIWVKPGCPLRGTDRVQAEVLDNGDGLEADRLDIAVLHYAGQELNVQALPLAGPRPQTGLEPVTVYAYPDFDGNRETDALSLPPIIGNDAILTDPVPGGFSGAPVILEGKAIAIVTNRDTEKNQSKARLFNGSVPPFFADLNLKFDAASRRSMGRIVVSLHEPPGGVQGDGIVAPVMVKLQSFLANARQSIVSPPDFYLGVTWDDLDTLLPSAFYTALADYQPELVKALLLTPPVKEALANTLLIRLGFVRSGSGVVNADILLIYYDSDGTPHVEPLENAPWDASADSLPKMIGTHLLRKLVERGHLELLHSAVFIDCIFPANYSSASKENQLKELAAYVSAAMDEDQHFKRFNWLSPLSADCNKFELTPEDRLSDKDAGKVWMFIYTALSEGLFPKDMVNVQFFWREFFGGLNERIAFMDMSKGEFDQALEGNCDKGVGERIDCIFYQRLSTELRINPILK